MGVFNVSTSPGLSSFPFQKDEMEMSYRSPVLIISRITLVGMSSLCNIDSTSSYAAIGSRDLASEGQLMKRIRSETTTTCEPACVATNYPSSGARQQSPSRCRYRGGWRFVDSS